MADNGWAQRHWRTLVHNYSRGPGFRRCAPDLEKTYEKASGETHLSAINRMFLELACRWLGIQTPITSSEIYPDDPDRVERLITICRAAGAKRYLSGPRAKAYLDSERFAAAGIEVRFLGYQGYPAPRLSVIDGVLRS